MRIFSCGWLWSDAIDKSCRPLFHRFRIYPLQLILRETFSSPPQPREESEAQSLIEKAEGWNATVDLAYLLEPVYWPEIVAYRSFAGNEQEHRVELDSYKAHVLRLVEQLDVEEWCRAHRLLRITAARMDDNPELYLLLRVFDLGSSREAYRSDFRLIVVSTHS